MKRKKIVEVKEIARLPEHVVNRVAAGEVRDLKSICYFSRFSSVVFSFCFVLFALDNDASSSLSDVCVHFSNICVFSLSLSLSRS